jgi:hypothetical protein
MGCRSPYEFEFSMFNISKLQVGHFFNDIPTHTNSYKKPCGGQVQKYITK